MQLHFADDSQEQPVEIYHKLKLYDEADPNNPSTKKPVGCTLCTSLCLMLAPDNLP